MRRSVFLVVVVGTLSWGCHGSSVGDAPNDEDAASDANDGDAGDGSGDGAADAGVNVLDDPDLEEPSCASWSGGDEATTFEVDGIFHSGSKSCLVCGNVGKSVWGLGQDVSPTKLVDGVTYRAIAWVRAPDPDAGPPADGGASINLSIYKNDGTEVGTQAENGPVTLDATWRQLTVTRAWDATGDKLNMSVLARKEGGCFLVDDASLARIP